MAADPQLPAGMAPLFKGWNVWTVSQVDDLGDLNPLNWGIPKERRLRIWIEEAADATPGAAVADPANPAALKGAQVEIISSTEGLEPAASRPVELVLGEASHAFHVRFYNRGAPGVTPWPHDSEYLLEDVWQPSSASPITNGPRPDSLAGAATDAVNSAGQAVAVVAAVALGVGLLWMISQGRRGR